MAHVDTSLDEQFDNGIRVIQRAYISCKGRLTATDQELEQVKSALSVSEGKVRALTAELDDAKHTIQQLQNVAKTMKAELSKLYTFKKSIIDSLEDDKVLSASIHDIEIPTTNYNPAAVDSHYKNIRATSPLLHRTSPSSVSSRSYSPATSSYSSAVPLSSASNTSFGSNGYPHSPTYSRKYNSIPTNETVDLIAQIDKRLSVEELTTKSTSHAMNTTHLSSPSSSSSSQYSNMNPPTTTRVTANGTSSHGSVPLSTPSSSLSSASHSLLNPSPRPIPNLDSISSTTTTKSSINPSPRSTLNIDQLPIKSSYAPPPSPSSSAIPTSPPSYRRPSSPPRYPVSRPLDCILNNYLKPS